MEKTLIPFIVIPESGAPVSKRGPIPSIKERQQEEPILPAYYGKLPDTMAKLSSSAAEKTKKGKLVMTRDNVMLLIDNAINNIPVVWGINAHKLLSWGLGHFILANPALREADISEVNVNYEALIPLRAFCLAMGYDVIPHDNSKAEKERAAAVLRKARQRIKQDLERLRNVKATWSEGVKKGGKAIARAGEPGAADRDFMSYSLIGSYGITKEFITMTFDPKFVKDYLLLLPQTKYHKALTRVKGRNAYLMGLKLLKHYCMRKNVEKKTNNRLKVKSILASVDLPTIDYIEGQRNPDTGRREGGADPGHWDKRIKERLEEALDELYNVGFLGFWGYKGTGCKELTDEEATGRSAEAWAEMLVQFEIIGNVIVEE